MSAEFKALAASVLTLRDLVGRLVPDDLVVSAFPIEWTVAETLSHIGSGAAITLGRIDASLSGGGQYPIESIREVWAEWDSKDPQRQAADALLADEAMLERFAELTDDERSRVAVAFGPTVLGYDALLRTRVSEHALHTWDARVAFDTDAVVEQESVEIVIDQLGPTAAWGGKPDGSTRAVSVRTTNPERGFVITTDADRVTLTSTDPVANADVVLPAESFIRLIYGRLPEKLTPAGVTGESCVAELRTVFRGV